MSRILIIDDDKGDREELRDRIVSMGHVTDEARSVQEALEKLKRTAFDCVLLDLGVPVNLEGRPRVENGQNLLGQIVAMPDAPPVIIITANGLNSHRLAVAMIEMGAATFVGKPFRDDPIEPKIAMVLERRAGARPASAASKPKEFRGGTLIVTHNGLELCGEPVGGGRKDASIRQIVQLLSVKGAEHYRRMSIAELANAIGGDVTPQTVVNAIKDFRKRCQRAVGARPQDVIVSTRGGGYRLADWIEVRFESDSPVGSMLKSDKAAVIRTLQRCEECSRKELASQSGLSEARLAAALGALDDEGQLLIRGSGSGTVYSMKNTR